MNKKKIIISNGFDRFFLTTTAYGLFERGYLKKLITGGILIKIFDPYLDC